MKYALFTYQFIGPVEDEEEAATIAMKIEESAELNIESVLEQRGVSREQVAEVGLRLLGVSVAVFDELPVNA